MLLALLVVYGLLIITALNGLIPNQRGYWVSEHGSLGDYSFSYGHVTIKNGSINVGDITSKGPSWAIWKLYIYSFPFMSKTVRITADTYVLIKEATPFSFWEFKPKRIVWQDNNFTEGWELQTYNHEFANVLIKNDTISFFGNLTTKRNYYRYSKNLPVNVSTNEYPYLVAKYKSSDKLAYLGVWNIHTNIGGYHSLYSGGDWKVAVIKLPMNMIVNRIEIGIDDALDPSVQGRQLVVFDYVMLSSVMFEPPNIQVALNGHMILNEQLIFSESGLFRLNPMTSFITETRFGYSILKIPFNPDFLKTENMINISVSPHTFWKIDWIDLYMRIPIGDVYPPAWASYMPKEMLVFLFSVEVITAYSAITKVRKWITQKHEIPHQQHNVE